jgi:hypothetical protein
MGTIATEVSHMAEQTVGLVHYSKKPTLPTPTFDGTTDVDNFISQFGRVAGIMGWDQPEAAIRFQMTVSGPAQKGLTATTLDGMCSQLRSRYRLSEDGAVVLLKTLKWKANDDIHEFAAYVRKLVDKAFPELNPNQMERRAIKELTNALPPSCHLLVWELRNRTPNNYEEVVTLVQEFNEMNLGTRVNKVEVDEVTMLRKEVAAQATLIEQMVATQAEMQKQLSSALSQLRPRRDNSSIICYRCQQPGHIARSCNAAPVKPRQTQPSENATVQQRQA